MSDSPIYTKQFRYRCRLIHLSCADKYECDCILITRITIRVSVIMESVVRSLFFLIVTLQDLTSAGLFVIFCAEPHHSSLHRTSALPLTLGMDLETVFKRHCGAMSEHR